MRAKHRVPVHHSIGLRLLRYVFGVYVIIALALTAAHMLEQYWSKKNATLAEFELHQRALQNTLTTAVWHLDTEQIDGTLRGLIEFPSIVGASVVSSEGELISAAGTLATQDRELPAIQLTSLNQTPAAALHYSDQLFQYRFELIQSDYGESELIGYVTLYSSPQALYSQLQNLYGAIIVTALIKTLALWLIFIYFGRKLLSQPLDALLKRVETLPLNAAGTSTPAPNESATELELLDHTLQNMQQRLDSTLRVLLVDKLRQQALAEILQTGLSDTPLKQQLHEALQQIVRLPWPSQPIGASIHVLNPAGAMQLSAHAGFERMTLMRCQAMPKQKCLTPSGDCHPEFVDMPALTETDCIDCPLAGAHKRFITPIRTQQETLGALNLYLPAGYQANEAEQAFLQAAADTIGGLLQRKTAEKALQQAHAELEDKVQQRTAALLQANEALLEAKQIAESASAAKSQFVANMSHELRTPLNGVLGMLQLLQQSELNASQMQMLNTAQHSGALLLKLIGNVLDLSKMEAGELDLEQIDFNLPSMLDSCLAPCRARAALKGLSLHCEIDHSLPTHIKSDPLKLQQVLNNLLSNAIKFTEHGGITMRVGKLAETDQRLHLRFEVEDSGIGIDPQMHQQIFDSFVQADSSTTRRYGGTGLGLSISRRLVERLGGELQLDSAINRGSRFWFDLSVEPGQALAALEDSASALPAPPTGLRVLVVDDNQVNQQVAGAMLQKLGCVIDYAEDGQQALLRWQSGNFDLIFMDCQMPTLNGYDATRQIRQLEAQDSHIPIIAFTAHALQHEFQACYDAGMDDVLTKPIKMDDLRRTLQQWALRAQTSSASP